MEDVYGSSDEEYCDQVYNDDDSDYDGLYFDKDCDGTRAPSCKIITKDSLLAAQKEDLQRLMDLLSIKEYHARTLLIHYCWDVDKVFTVFVEKGKERLYADAGLTIECKDDGSLSESTAEMTCEICFDDIPAAKTTIMDCGHSFCNDCWTEHFIVQINEGHSKRIKCMAYKCNAICDEGKIRDLVRARDQELAEKFDHFLLESYIDDNKQVKWCPSTPHCGNAIRLECDECCEVECACGLQFCFGCSSETHSPCSCLMWEMWMKKCGEDSGSVDWLTANTKYCPKCSKPVEKSGGCNLVQCICGQPFCWLCGGATGINHTWESIEGHTCGRFKESHEDKKVFDSRKQMFRYSHYYSRYKAHSDSLKAEASMKQKLQEKVLNLELKGLASKDFGWVTNGFYRLSHSRRLLSYSYAFAYYMFGDELYDNDMTQREKDIKQDLFEDQQQQLETNIERLSMCLDEKFDDFPEDKVVQMKMKIVTLSGVIDNFCTQLYDCIESDLLIHLQSNHNVAPYSSRGALKASELEDSFLTSVTL
ncbi:PREDICTED: probable E3 ubiquitin-protein ligase ARI2 [Ipomoea nil]|uniref:probable E3 ubiquitin-protein ligase ARI2 n=1 Tax=Ipomoea nil TaxID=35883 RepID=UPI0009017BC6|nr:PREDICTED: probable E3 ubiquitin-protein ligase ARI2 [Ipomoea nil]